MPTARENFDTWYGVVLRDLCAREDAGFVLLCTALPLLERYLREKSGVKQGTLNEAFYDELRAVFPVLADNQIAKTFWGTYRNGLLHQVTMAQSTASGSPLRPARLAWEGNQAVELRAGEFFVHPGAFTKSVLENIEKNFTTFEGTGSPAHPFPTIDDQTHSTSSFAPPTSPSTG